LRGDRAGDHAQAADILEEKHLLKDAVDEQSRAAAILSALAAQDPDNATTRSFLGQAYGGLGVLQEKSGNLGDAEQSFLGAAQAHERVLGTDPKNAFARVNLANDYRHLGTLQVRQGRLAPGMASLNKALAVIEPLASGDPNNSDLRTSFADIYSGLGSASEALARSERDARQHHSELQRACDWYRRSAAVWLDLSSRHLLDASQRDRPEKAGKAQAACQAELAHWG